MTVYIWSYNISSVDFTLLPNIFLSAYAHIDEPLFNICNVVTVKFNIVLLIILVFILILIFLLHAADTIFLLLPSFSYSFEIILFRDVLDFGERSTTFIGSESYYNFLIGCELIILFVLFYHLINVCWSCLNIIELIQSTHKYINLFILMSSIE